jgi:hypothetical protein
MIKPINAIIIKGTPKVEIVLCANLANSIKVKMPSFLPDTYHALEKIKLNENFACSHIGK